MTHDFDQIPCMTGTERAQYGMPLAEAALENYKKSCSPDTERVKATAYFGRYALAWRE